MSSFLAPVIVCSCDESFFPPSDEVDEVVVFYFLCKVH